MTIRKLIASIAAAALMVGSAAPSFAATSDRSINPLVALSIVGSPASQAAFCGASTAAAAASSAALQGAAPGCVLPVVDAPPPPVVSEAPPPMVPPPPAPGIGALPLLLGLAGIVAAVLLLRGGNDGTIFIDIPPQPATPTA